MYDYLIVGSGLYGSTFAHLAHKAGKKCLVIDRRPQHGGNLYCEDVDGIHVHKYGAHIFHTSNKKVWDFVNSIVPFNRYTNSPIANYQGKLFNLPFNMNTFNSLWGCVTPADAESILSGQRLEAIKKLQNDGVKEPRNLEEQALLLVGRDIYEVLIKGYTQKQWGRPCTELPPSIIKRLPVRMVFDNNYFSDLYQGVPIGGYNKLIAGLLQGVECRTGIDFIKGRSELSSFAKTVVYTGAIDEYFGYSLGPLKWRSVRFEQERLPVCNYQGNAVINYTDAATPYTRIIEHKHFESFGDEVYQKHHTVISREFSVEWAPGMEPFYPINDVDNNRLYAAYKEMASQETNVIFGGRLAEYIYYDMAPTIEAVFEKTEKLW